MKKSWLASSFINILLSVFCLNSFAVANNVTALKLTPLAKGQITLHNTGNSVITNLRWRFSDARIRPYFGGSCLEESYLAAGGQCNLTYQLPAVPLTGKFILKAIGMNSNNGAQVLAVTIMGRGHLAFQQKGRGNITQLNLLPLANQAITLRNTGGSAVKNLRFNFSNATVRNYFTGSCFNTKDLAAGANCILWYTLPAKAVIGQSTITAKALSADNSPHRLNIHIASQGHLTFRNRQGKAITALTLAPLAQGTVVLRNSGGSAVTDLAWHFPNRQLRRYFTGNCLKLTRLAVGSQCSLHYRLPAAPLIGQFSLKASAANVGNGVPALTLNIIDRKNSRGINSAEQGHLVFVNGQTAAKQLSYDTLLQVRKPYFVTGAIGGAFTSAGASQTVSVMGFSSNTYTVSSGHARVFIGQLGFGYQWPVHWHHWAIANTVSIIHQAPNRVKGNVYETGPPEGAHYHYDVKSTLVMLGLTFTYVRPGARWVPYLQLLLGDSFNRADDYQRQNGGTTTSPSLAFQGKTTTNVAYGIGIGIQRFITTHWVAGIAYQAMDLGKAYLDNGHNGYGAAVQGLCSDTIVSQSLQASVHYYF